MNFAIGRLPDLIFGDKQLRCNVLGRLLPQLHPIGISLANNYRVHERPQRLEESEARAMEILSSIALGTLAGGLLALFYRSTNFSITTSMGVGILGGLLGLACDFWLARKGLCNIAYGDLLASSIGAAVTLFLWIVAQRLFLASPPPAVGD